MEEYLHLVEFTYNNGYQTFLKMSPSKALYGQKCNLPIRWDKTVDRLMLGLDMLKDLEKMESKVKQNLKIDQDRHKSYGYLKQIHKEFEVGNHVYLKLKPNKSTLRLGSFAKLAPRFSRHFQVLA